MTTTYWYLQPRGLGNEYTVGVADNEFDAEQYDTEGYRKIERDEALTLMSKRAESGEELYVDAQLNGRSANDRFRFARSLRTGRDDYTDFS